jgi:hypothetical protein
MTKAINIRVSNPSFRYVAIKPGRKHEVVAEGRTLVSTLRKARAAGSPDAGILFVPRSGERYIF